jgi:hypothetical protein
VAAQGAVTKYSLLIIAPGANPATASPVQSTDYLVNAFVCNQVAPTVPASVTNPTQFFFDDPANVGKVCIASLTATTLTALPNAPGYVGVVTATDDLGQVSARSAASNPFNRQGPPAAPTGIRVK